jgi:thiol:disulfide interchange protein DsbC
MKSFIISILIFASSYLSANQAIIDSLKTTFPNITEKNIFKTPIKGFYEIVVGTRILYISEDGRYLAQGELYDMKVGTNLTQQRKAGLAKDILAKVDDADKVIFKAKDEKYVLNVFTDTDCPYCRKLHKGMDEMNKLGITIKYLAFPRAGIKSKSYDTAVSIWCSDDKQKAMNDAKNLKKIEKKTCENPVQEHLLLVPQLGVTGTPSGFLENGQNVPGYLPPKRLLERLKQLSL